MLSTTTAGCVDSASCHPGARIEEAWWLYHPDRMREEVALARHVHANCIRLWIEFSAWMADPDKVTANFLDAVKAIAEAGMKAMPCLLNRWHDDRFDYGGTYTENLLRNWRPHLDYVRSLVAPLVADDRVLLWDLCNEPQAFDLNSEVNRQEFAWLKAVAETVRACGARQPITIGTMAGKNIELYAPLMDVLCGHPYAHNRKDLEGLMASFDTMRKSQAKPFVVNECIPGSLNDATRAEVARFYTEMLSAAGFGWMGWRSVKGRPSRPAATAMTPTASTARAFILSSPKKENCATDWSFSPRSRNGSRPGSEPPANRRAPKKEHPKGTPHHETTSHLSLARRVWILGCPVRG